MSAPRIGVSGVVRTWDGLERTGVNTAYVRSILEVGGVPLVLSPLLGPSYASRALEGVDGLLFTGGEDLDPAWYGAAPSPFLHTVSRDRDLFELALFAGARQRELPILGICRGIQLINVAMGGTLYQDLPSERPDGIDHNASCERSARIHSVRVESESRAAAAVGTASLRVNSFHHQAIRDLAPPLLATAWSDDGMIEAVETPAEAPWLLAVQWHPEEMHGDKAAPERGLFRSLVEEAARTLTECRAP